MPWTRRQPTRSQRGSPLRGRLRRVGAGNYLDRDWRSETVALLGELVPGGGALRALTVPFENDECEWFVRGWEAALYPVGACPNTGLKHTCSRDRLDHFLTTSGRHRHLLTRWTVGGWGLSREYVTHLGAFAKAILAYGYPQAGSLLSHYGRYSRDLLTRREGGSYEIDAAFPAGPGERPLLLIEAKAEPREVARWAAAIDAGATPADLVGIGFKEIEYVLDLAPQHLWLVGPGTVDPAANVWAVTVHGLRTTFTRLDDVPRPDVAE